MIISPSLDTIAKFITQGVEQGNGKRYTVKRFGGVWIARKTETKKV